MIDNELSTMNVDQICDLIRNVFLDHPTVTLRGTVSKVGESKRGNLFFCLSYDNSTLRCVAYKQYHRHLKNAVINDIDIEATGKLTFDSNNGWMQFVVTNAKPIAPLACMDQEGEECTQSQNS